MVLLGQGAKKCKIFHLGAMTIHAPCRYVPDMHESAVVSINALKNSMSKATYDYVIPLNWEGKCLDFL